MPGDVPSLASIGRVCIVHLTGIGDVVHGLPIANDLRRSNPDLEIVWVAEPAPSEVLRHHPAVDRIVVFRKGAGVRGVLELRRTLRPIPSDLVVNMQRYAKSVFPALFAGAPIRLGLPPSKTRDGVRWFNTHALPEQPWRHTQDLLLDFRKPLGIPSADPVEWRITFSAAELEERARFFGSLRERPVVGLVLASANHRKDWPADRYARLADALTVRGYTPILLGGPGAAEQAAADVVRRAASCDPLDARDDSVRAMMWKVSGVDLLVSPDTGPLHIAHALEVPVVGLFGHTNPWRTGPWRRYHDLVLDRYTEPGQDPDPSGYAPKEGRMEAITVEDVLEAVELARSRYLDA